MSVSRSRDRPERWRATTLTMVILALIPGLILSAPAAAANAATKNANFDGDWTVNGGHVVITDEDVATGEFGGSLVGPHSTLDIVDGEVTGNAYTFTVEVADTVVGVNGAQFTYGGTFSGNTMTITETAIHAWKNGHPVSASSTDPGPFTGTREDFNLSGEIDLGCGSNANTCSANGTPFEGFEVDVTGDNGSATSTTDDEGKWNVDLPTGSYTITPTSPIYTFTPSEIHVDLTKTETDENFRACSASSIASEERLVSHTSGVVIYDLTGTNIACYATFRVTDTKTATAKNFLNFSWTTKALTCDKVGDSGSSTFTHALKSSMTVQLAGSLTVKKNSAGVVVHITAENSKSPHPFIDATINPGYRSGSVVLNGQPLKEATTTSDGFLECYPYSGSVGLSTSP
jgi:hypothetical protein